jgi:predicted PurR-regulated permease PerM
VTSTQFLRLFFCIILFVISATVLEPFWSSVGWAGLIAIIFWPAYHFLECRWQGSPNLTAGLFTFLLMVCLSFPLVWGISEVQQELPTLSQIASHFDSGKLNIPEWIQKTPIVGNTLARLLEITQVEKGNHSELIRSIVGSLLKKASRTLQHVPQNTAGLLLTVVSLFFFFRDGRTLGHHLQIGLSRMADCNANTYLNNITSTTRAVAYGIFGSAMLQGVIASMGFWIFGFETPFLLGLLTSAASLIPIFGTILIWGPIALWMIFQKGDVTTGLGLIAWGALLINPADNIFRPLVISYGAHHPLLLIILGVMGGIFSLGPIGIFIGPLCLTTLAQMWLKWIEKDIHTAKPKLQEE